MLLLLWILDPSCQIVYKDKFQKGGINEEHADTIPEVHGCQAGDHRELGAESEMCSNFLDICGYCVTFVREAGD